MVDLQKGWPKLSHWPDYESKSMAVLHEPYAASLYPGTGKRRHASSIRKFQMDETTDQDDQKLRRLKSIFDGDGTEIREQFIYAGLLLTIFERLKTYVVNQVDGFFSNHIEFRGGETKYRRAEKFKTLIKERGNGQPGQHNNQVFRAALHWFHECGAIDKEELDDVERLYSLRNEIGHELLLILAEDGKQPITIYDVLLAFIVYVKIVRWWWKEVECATDPDMTKEKHDSVDWDEVETTDTMLLREIFNKALSDNLLWQDMQKTAMEEGGKQL
jgi:hypothetical protein